MNYRARHKYVVLILTLIVLLLCSSCLGDFTLYKRIGNTNFYLVETMANSSKGRPLPGLFYSNNPREFGFAGVHCKGVPFQIFWDENYVVVKSTDRDATMLISFCIIRYFNILSDSPEDNYELLEYTTEIEYYEAMNTLGLSESEMNQTNNIIPWRLH